MAAAVFAATATALAGSAAPALAAPSFGSRVLQRGMRGADVRTLQADLTAAGISTRVDGVFDRPTYRSVLAFQRRYHLSVDGVVGPQTAGRIRTIDRQLATAASTDTPSATAPSAGAATGTTTTSTDATGGTSFAPGPNDGPVAKATLNSQGLAVPPPNAPTAIVEIIDAANQIATDPYRYGGGHASFTDTAYDCSGSVSYALHGGGLVSSPLDSTGFESYGSQGAGRWITIWANAGHAYMQVAGLWFDTAAQSGSGGNDRWSTTRASSSFGFVVRHPGNW